MIVFPDDSCKIENAYMIDAMVVKCWKRAPFGIVCGGRPLQLLSLIIRYCEIQSGISKKRAMLTDRGPKVYTNHG